MADANGVTGCDYCRDPTAAALTDGLAAGPGMTYLLRCPACGQYYGGCGVEPHYRPPLSPAEVAELFPDYNPDAEPDSVPDRRGM